jgi:hypothetical protein
MTFLNSAILFMHLFEIDKKIWSLVKSAPCPCCGGKIHARHWFRKGFGVPAGIEDGALIRHSGKCSVCSLSITPNSLRFIYYKRMYVVPEILHRLWDNGLHEISEQLKMSLILSDKDLKELERWWDEVFRPSIFVKQKSAQIPHLSNEKPLGTIVKHFESDVAKSTHASSRLEGFFKNVLERILKFLARYRTDIHWRKFRHSKSLEIDMAYRPFSME